jgi:Holliday junction resolvasome RuvABC endonuclease subunit
MESNGVVVASVPRPTLVISTASTPTPTSVNDKVISKKNTSFLISKLNQTLPKPTKNPKKRSRPTASDNGKNCKLSEADEETTRKKKKTKRVQAPIGTLAPKLKNIRIPQMIDWTRKLRQERRVICGIDMSLSNPGLCLLIPLEKRIHLYCFRNRKRERYGVSQVQNVNSPFFGWTLDVSLIESSENEKPSNRLSYSLFRFTRYEERLQKLLSIIGTNNKLVGIEGFSYNSKPTQADTFLKELGGCLRLSLCRMKHTILEIPPSTVKKIFTQNGQASKVDMYKTFVETYHLPDLFALLNIGDEDKKIDKTLDHVPHPIEDIVDALAVAMSLLWLV